jgi:hypothetical protein
VRWAKLFWSNVFLVLANYRPSLVRSLVCFLLCSSLSLHLVLVLRQPGSVVLEISVPWVVS